MALNRLENFLKSARGKILHVNPEDLSSTDSITNDGSSPFTPFKTINRALVEAARYSYQIGLSNDRFNFCTILLYSGEHYVDNRPGAVIEDDGTTYLRSSATATINQFDLNTELEITDPNNKLYLLNSINGGLIVPRGTSIIAQDIRKTVIRPLYVPDPENNNIERSAIFRITGASFFYGFSILDANPGGFCYKNYTPAKFTPNFSHHKLTAFEYVDGVNDVVIDDDFLDITTTRTDLQQYYEKISLVYGASSGREIDDVTYTGGVSVDIQPVIDEFRIVGSRGEQVGISSIISGNGVTPSQVITVTLDTPADGIAVDTSIQISGVGVDGYDGQFVVSSIPTPNQVKYTTPNIPTIASPLTFGATLNIVSDTIQSASPYIFNCSLRSVYGMCGLHADGSKVEGFKSVVVAQFTAISLQKDNNAFIIYNDETGSYVDNSVVPDLYKNTRSKYKPSYENFHIKVSNDAFAQLVSVFSIGYAAQIIAESGGDYSVTNSNSNFGAKTFISSGYKKNAFDQDDHGYIVGIIPPKEIENNTLNIEFSQIDVGLTTSVSSGAASTTKLYLYNEKNENVPPEFYIDGYKIGAKIGDTLNIATPVSTSSLIVMPNTNSNEKVFTVQRQNNNTENSIASGVITLTSSHTFEAGEKVKIIADTGQLPDGIENKIYYVINSTIDISLTTSQIKLASTYNNAINNIAILPNRTGGTLSVVSRVTDKVPSDPGHPVQWDATNNNWYITVNSSNNGIYSAIKDLQVLTTGKTFVVRTPDKRLDEDKIFKVLYSIPNRTSTAARPPVGGFIIQESNDTLLSGTEFVRYFGTTDLASDNEIRNPKIISTASWSSNQITITTELPHKFNVGDEVEILNVTPSGYNGTYSITNIPTSRSFVCSLTTDPGLFSNDTRNRNSNLPYVKKKNTKNIFQIYKVNELQEYIQNTQDGVYELILINASNSPTVSPFLDYKFSQPIENLYPQFDRDNPQSNPDASICFANSNIIGDVSINDEKNSITRETVNKLNADFNVGLAITSIVSNPTGISHTVYTATDHGLSAITNFSIVSTGSSYVTGTYYGVGVTTTSQGTAAAFKVQIDATARVSSVDLMYGGSQYAVGDRISLVSGIQTSSGFVPAVLNVTAVSNNLNDCVSISGFAGTHTAYNDTYRITSINTPKQFIVSSASTISNSSIRPVSVDGSAVFVGKSISVSSLVYDNITGISTVTFVEPHGLKVNSKIRFTGFTSVFYNQDVLITSVNSSTIIEADFGVSSSIPSTSGTSRICIPLNLEPDFGDNRTKYYYSGISTTSGGPISATDPDGTTFNIRNAFTVGLKQGDYIEVNGEVMRIKSRVTSGSNDIVVYRAKFGTDRKSHTINSVIRKINIIPIELRRNSIIRASGHTFEYVGYGAGNYSTSLPENQDREISIKEKNIAHSTKIAGGAVYYTGMDENGDFYSGNKKISSSTGRERTYDSPVYSITGEDLTNDYNIVIADKGQFLNSIKVTGQSLSQFDGPVFFDKKVTIDDNLEVNSLVINGEDQLSRTYGIASTTPSILGDTGDIKFESSPDDGGSVGWVFTEQNAWRRFGPIQNANGRYVGIWDGEHYGKYYGDGSSLTGLDSFWRGTATGITTTSNVGVGTTQADANFTFRVDGNSFINGVLNVGEIVERITIDTTTILQSSTTLNVDLSENNVYYYTTSATGNWAVNFTSTNVMKVGETITVALMTTQGSTAYYNSSVSIESSTINVFEYGDLPIVEGNANGIDLYTYVIVKKSDVGSISDRFTVLRSLSQYTQQ